MEEESQVFDFGEEEGRKKRVKSSILDKAQTVDTGLLKNSDPIKLSITFFKTKTTPTPKYVTVSNIRNAQACQGKRVNYSWIL